MTISDSIAAIVGLFRNAGDAWMADKAPRLGAAISYYTVFSLAPLLLISITVSGFVVGGDAARQGIIDAMGGLVGQDGGKAIEAMIDSAASNKSGGVVASAIGLVMLLFGASGVFIELQDALNTVWDVEAKPSDGVVGFIRVRLLSFAMVLGIGFLLLVSMVLTAVLAAVGNWMSQSLPGGVAIWQVINMAVSLVVTTGLFAMIFKFVPDVKIAWRDVAVGAAVTAVLFTLGKFLIGVYLGTSGTANVFGAAGSLVIVFIWVYYSAQIVLFGAEFTQAWANTYGSHKEAGAGDVLARGALPIGNKIGAVASGSTSLPA